MYLAGGSVGLLLIVWSALAMKDHAGSAATSAQTSPPTAAEATPQVLIPPTAEPVAKQQSALISPTPSVKTPQPALIPPAAPDATQQPAVASSDLSSGGSTVEPQATAEPTATASPRPTQKPQTRSRGS